MKTQLTFLLVFILAVSGIAQNNVGIGTPTPAAKLHVIENNGNITIRSRNIQSGPATTYSVMGENLGSNTNDRIGVFGNSLGDANATAIYGIYGKGNPNSSDITSYGGYFLSENTGNGIHYGVFGEAEGDGNYGLFGKNLSAAGWAGYFDGRLQVTKKLGVGMDPGQEKVAISGAGRTGLYLENVSSTTDTIMGINMLVDSNSTSTRFALHSIVQPNTASTANAYGLYSLVKVGGTGTHYGVHGTANGSGNIGVFGKSNQTGTGVLGENTANDGTGVHGIASGTGTAIKGTLQSGSGWAGYFEGNTYVENRVEVSDKIFLRPTGNGSGAEIELFDNDGDQTVTIRAGQNTTNGAEILMYNDANTKTVEIDADVNSSGEIYLYDNDGDATVLIRAAQNATNGAEFQLFNDANVKTIELDADFNGVGRVITDELEIKAGSDLAEFFNITEKEITIEAGMVVAIDKKNAGDLQINGKAYNSMAIGVISGANGIRPGMLMGQEGTIAYGDWPVAMSGRVYVKADARKNRIKVGDLLTSADLEGHAMKASNRKKSRNAILGRALTGLDSGTGFVLMIID